MIPALLLGLAGGLLLLLGLFSKRLLPQAYLRWRVPFLLFGVILLVATAWLAIHRQSARLAAAPAPFFPSSPPTTTPLESSGQPPVILGIQTRKASTAMGLVITADIHFQDPDGDADTFAFETAQSTVAGVTLEPEPIDASPQEQIQGTTQTLEWLCQDSGSMVQFRVVILDRAGHHSNVVPMLFDCG